MTPEQILNILQNYLRTALQQGIITLVSSGPGNARSDSAQNERLIGNSLRSFALGHPIFTQGSLAFEVTTNGTWYDFLVCSGDESVWMPINLKVSSLQGNDNLSSKEGLFFALTGKKPSGGMIRNWELFCSNIAQHAKRTDCAADYYYLVVEKASPEKPKGDVFWTSLLKLQRVTPNGSNPPFQCCWRENVDRSTRSRQEAVDNLLDVVGETFVLRAKALESFRNHIVPGMSSSLRQKWAGLIPGVAGESD